MRKTRTYPRFNESLEEVTSNPSLGCEQIETMEGARHSFDHTTRHVAGPPLSFLADDIFVT